MADDGQDRPPIGMVDIEAVSPSLALAPNFALDELASPVVGRWAVLQPHAIASLQAMRDAAGPIAVLVGYLSPSVNEAQGGALYARHQYGDGFDLDPIDVSPDALADLCVAEGGEAVVFESHIHCEFHAVPLDEDFFGPPPAAGAIGPGSRLELDAWIEIDGAAYWAPALGFLEGEPRRQWTARDGGGAVVGVGEGRSFVPPPEAVTIEVRVGGRVIRSVERGR